MTKLSVNINKVALIRNARGSNLPDLVKVAKDCEAFGAEGITVHPRPDQRHVKYSDVPLLKKALNTEFNIEGYPSPDFIELVLANLPHQVTLVPDPPNVLTSSEGWNMEKEGNFLTKTITQFKSAGIRVSLFIEPIPESVRLAEQVGADRVELYTGHYANDYVKDPSGAVKKYFETSLYAQSLNIGLNAGHDLNLDNLQYFKQNTTDLLEVSIGHALICDALYYGLKNTILMYKNLLK